MSHQYAPGDRVRFTRGPLGGFRVTDTPFGPNSKFDRESEVNAGDVGVYVGPDDTLDGWHRVKVTDKRGDLIVPVGVRFIEPDTGQN